MTSPFFEKTLQRSKVESFHTLHIFRDLFGNIHSIGGFVELMRERRT